MQTLVERLGACDVGLQNAMFQRTVMPQKMLSEQALRSRVNLKKTVRSKNLAGNLINSSLKSGSTRLRIELKFSISG